MKEIKDYLPFYIGCEVWYKEQLWDLVGVSKPYRTNGTMFINLDLRPKGQGYRSIASISEAFTDLSLIKLILRPLSDMTQEELKEYVEFRREAHDSGRNKYRINNGSHTGLSEGAGCLWLTKHWFDIFFLIEAGLAIGSKTSTFKRTTFNNKK